MSRDDRGDDGVDRSLALMDDRESRMPLYLTAFLLTVTVFEQVGQLLLT